MNKKWLASVVMVILVLIAVGGYLIYAHYSLLATVRAQNWYGCPSKSSAYQADPNLISTSRTALIKLGFSPSFVDAHFKVIPPIWGLPDYPKQGWDKGIGGAGLGGEIAVQMCVEDYNVNIEIVPDKKNNSATFPQQEAYPNSAHDFVNLISATKAESTMQSCIGAHTSSVIIYGSGYPADGKLYLRADASSDPWVFGMLNLETGQCTKSRLGTM